MSKLEDERLEPIISRMTAIIMHSIDEAAMHVELNQPGINPAGLKLVMTEMAIATLLVNAWKRDETIKPVALAGKALARAQRCIDSGEYDVIRRGLI